MDKYIIVCSIVFVVLYINNLFQLFTTKWVNLLFNIDFFIFACYFVNKFKTNKFKKNKG